MDADPIENKNFTIIEEEPPTEMNTVIKFFLGNEFSWQNIWV